ncbi:hypothetical protein ABVN80_18130 [Acinetobacter baumannii]
MTQATPLNYFLIQIIHLLFLGEGQAQALLQPQIAIVGSRKPSPHGRQVAYDFAYYLSEKGFSLVVVWLMALMKPHIKVHLLINVPLQ